MCAVATIIPAMTAHDISIKEELTEAGFDDCLFKPFRPEALESLLAPAAQEAATEESAAEETTAEEREKTFTAMMEVALEIA